MANIPEGSIFSKETGRDITTHTRITAFGCVGTDALMQEALHASSAEVQSDLAAALEATRTLGRSLLANGGVIKRDGTPTELTVQDFPLAIQNKVKTDHIVYIGRYARRDFHLTPTEFQDLKALEGVGPRLGVVLVEPNTQDHIQPLLNASGLQVPVQLLQVPQNTLSLLTDALANHLKGQLGQLNLLYKNGVPMPDAFATQIPCDILLEGAKSDSL